MKTYYITIEYANGLEDYYAARANGYYAYEDTEFSMIIEKDYPSLEALHYDLDDMYGEIIKVESS